jgi:predicted permease
LPPRLAEVLLRLALPAGPAADSIRGDLLDEFAGRWRTHGPRAARRGYWRDSLSVVFRARALRRAMRPQWVEPRARPSLSPRAAARALVRRPVFSAVAVATLGVGVGATAAVASLAHAVLLGPLPYRDPERLVVVWGTSTREGGSRQQLSYLDVQDLREGNETLEDMALTSGPESLTLVADGRAERVVAEYVSPNYHPLLGFAPALGRGFLEEEDRTPDTHRVAILSHDFWVRRFGGDKGLVGRSLRLNEQTYTVVGVLQPGFRGGTDRADLWLPFKSVGLAFPGFDYVYDRRVRWAVSHARLRAGTTLEQARADLAVVAGRLALQHPDSNADLSVVLEPMVEAWLGELRAPLLLLLGAVTLVLGAVAVNLGHLHVVRALERGRDLKVRRALGASTRRLALELSTEGALLGGAAGTVGVLLAAGMLRVLPPLSPVELPSFTRLGLEPAVALVSFTAALVLGVVSSLVPLGLGAASFLEGAGRGHTETRPQLAAAHAFTISQVAFAVVLVAGAGLLGRSLRAQARSETGFEVEGLLTARAHLGSSRYETGPAVARVCQDLVERLEAWPGVEGAAATQSDLPPHPGAGLNWEMEIEERPVDRSRNRTATNWHRVTPGFFGVLRVPLRAGRVFTPDDTAQAPMVAVVSESFARHHWPEGALGRRLRSLRPEDDGSPAPWLEVVGVVGDVRYRDHLAPGRVQPDVYRPLAQSPAMDPRHVYLVARGKRVSALAPALRGAVAEVDPEVPVYEMSTMADRFGALLAVPRFLATVLAAFAALGAGLSALGLFGVTAYGVVRRRREVGTRVALGARPARILGLFLVGASRRAASGIVIGTVAAALLSRTLQAFLYGVGPADPLVLGGTAVLVGVVALAATYVPARRALRISPAEALRAE